jgi:hypothetical protein
MHSTRTFCCREGLAALLEENPRSQLVYSKDANQFAAALAPRAQPEPAITLPCSDTASAKKADAWAAPTIAFETGERIRGWGSSDTQSATRRHDVQVSGISASLRCDVCAFKRSSST